MLTLTKKTSTLIGTIVKHIHWCIWSFCLLFLVFKEVATLPLEFLYNFNFIPEFILNISKLTSSKPVETTIPEINVIPTNNDELIVVLKESISLLQQEMSIMNSKFEKLFALMQDNTVLLQKQLTFQKELFAMVEQKISSLNVLNELRALSYKLQDMNAILQVQTEANAELSSRIISQIKDTKTNLATLNNNVLDINKSILSLDFNKPLVNINDALNQVVINQKDLYTMYQNTQDIQLQGFNTLFQSQEAYFAHVDEQLNSIFSKVQEVRNHNLTLHQQLTKTIDFKLVEQQNEIIHQIIDEMNRVKTTKTEVNTVKSWSGFFDKTK